MIKKVVVFLLFLLSIWGGFYFYQNYLKVEEVLILNSDYEYQKKGSTYRVYSYNETLLWNKQLNIGQDKIRVSSYKQEKKLSYEELIPHFKHYFDYSDIYFIEDNRYKTYYSEKKLEYENIDKLYLKDLANNDIDIETDLMFKKEDKYFFARAENVRLIDLASVNSLKNIKDKKLFLKYLRDDFIKYGETRNKDLLIKAIIKKAESITENEKDKIKALYKWINDSLVYDISDINNRVIFSGVETYRNKRGVCDGYTKLFIYYLLAIGIEDVEQIPGVVFDSEDFWTVRHAWVRIGDKYYDPTFENTTTKDKDNIYFALPKEVFYGDRKDGLDIPKELEDSTLDQRKKLVLKRYKTILDNYSYKVYPLLDYYQLRLEVGRGFEKLTINDLARFYGWSELKGGLINYKNKTYNLLEYQFLELREDSNYLEQVIQAIGRNEALVVKENNKYKLIFNVELQKI